MLSLLGGCETLLGLDDVTLATDGGEEPGLDAGVPSDGGNPMGLAPFSLRDVPSTFAVPFEGRAGLQIELDRANSFNEPVAVVVETPPLGLSFETAFIEAGSNLGTLVLSASGELEIGSSLKVTILASAGLQRVRASLDLTVVGSPGSYDDRFGEGGVVIDVVVPGQGLGARVASFEDVDLFDDGSIAAAGSMDFFGGEPPQIVVKLDSTGARDLDWGEQGTATLEIGSCLFEEGGGRIATMSDGGVVVVGFVPVNNDEDVNVAIQRLAPDGTLDDSFAGDGLFTLNLGGLEESFCDVAIDPQGRIVAVGYTLTQQGIFEVVAVRLLPDGTADDSFSGNGLARLGDELGIVAFDIAFDAEGRILIAGDTLFEAAMALRLNQDGTLDESFGAGGLFLYPTFAIHQRVRALLRTAAGNYILAGLWHDAQQSSDVDDGWFLTQITNDGEPDERFGADGDLLLPLNGLDASVYDLIERPGGGFVAVGMRSVSVDEPVRIGLLARFTESGKRDLFIGDDGFVTLPQFEMAFAVRAHPEGGLIVVGQALSAGLIARVRE